MQKLSQKKGAVVVKILEGNDLKGPVVGLYHEEVAIHKGDEVLVCRDVS